MRKTDQEKILNSLERCAFLLKRITEGDHKALENAKDASKEAVQILKDNDHQGDEWMYEED